MGRILAFVDIFWKINKIFYTIDYKAGQKSVISYFYLSKQYEFCFLTVIEDIFLLINLNHY